MKAFFCMFVIVFSSFASAQDMSGTQSYEDSYVMMPDGSSRYIGKCSTHEDYYKFYYKTQKVIQRTVEPSVMDAKKVSEMIKKFDQKLVEKVLTALDFYDEQNKKGSEVAIFQDFIDDITVDTLSHIVFPKLELIRFNIGVGGGNGSYIIYNKIAGERPIYELMSRTFDSDLIFCDKKVWLSN